MRCYTTKYNQVRQPKWVRRVSQLFTFFAFLGWFCQCGPAQLCEPGSKSCRGTLAITCLADGTGWSINPCKPDEQCKEGICQPTSSPPIGCLPAGQTSCLERNILRTCQPDGSWKETPCQTGEACVSGRCEAREGCNTVGGKECKDARTNQECQQDGSWKSLPCAEDEFCKQGACLKKPTCKLKVQPTKLSFAKDESQQVTLQNVGFGTCSLLRVSLQSSNKTGFSVATELSLEQRIEPSAKLILVVKFEARQPGQFQDILLIESDDPEQARHEVELEANISPPTPCKLTASSTRLDFQTVGLNQSRTFTISIQNEDSRVCSITSAILRQSNDAFAFKSPLPFPVTLAPQEKLPLDVSFQPKQKVPVSIAQLEIQGSDKSFVLVDLTGKINDTCYSISLTPIDFGTAKQSCSTSTKTLTIRHSEVANCPATLTLKALAFEKGSNSEFSILQKPNLPISVTSSQPLILQLSYKPKNIGLDDDGLLITVEANALDRVLWVPLSGAGRIDDTQLDLFTQTGNLPVDVLFVVGNSCSMRDEQLTLVQYSGTFMAWAQNANIDYHIGVTSADSTGVRIPAGCLRNYRVQPTGLAKYITLGTSDGISALENSVNIGTNGSSTQRGMEAMEKALSAPTSIDPNCNKGFFRSDAILSVIFVNEKDDESRNTVAYYANFLKTLKNNYPHLIKVSAVSSTTCYPGSCRYRELTRLFGGIYNETSLPTAIGQIAALSFSSSLPSNFPLSKVPIPSTIVVKVDNKVISQNPSKSWQYTGNAISFAKPAIPLKGSKVEISYQPLCQP